MEKNFITTLIEFFKNLFTSGQKEPETFIPSVPEKNEHEPVVEDNEPENTDSGNTTIITHNVIENNDMEEKNELFLELKRIVTNNTYTIGHLYINGEYVCDTIEDADRGLKNSMQLSEINKKKIHGKTAIPTGTYDIAMNVKSPKYSDFNRYKWAKDFDGYLPRLLNVPGYEGVLIHVGNKPEDTEGCLLVGFNKSKGMVSDSTTTFKLLMNKYLLPAYKQNTKISIKITAEY